MHDHVCLSCEIFTLWLPKFIAIIEHSVCDQWGEKAFPTISFYRHFLEYFAKLCFHKQGRSWPLLNKVSGTENRILFLFQGFQDMQIMSKFFILLNSEKELYKYKCPLDGPSSSLKRIFLSFLCVIYDPDQNKCNA